MFPFVRKHAATFVVAFVTALVTGGSFVWAHNNPSGGHVTYAHKAGTANKVKGMTVLPLKKVSSSAQSDAASNSQAIARAAAKKVVLFQKAPFKVYLKCFTDTEQPDNPWVFGEIFIQTSGGKAVFASSDEDGSSNAYLVSSTPEQERQLVTESSSAGTGNPGTLNVSDGSEGIFYAASGTTHIEGQLFMTTKVGTPEVGNGPFGSGRRCMASGTIHYR